MNNKNALGSLCSVAMVVLLASCASPKNDHGHIAHCELASALSREDVRMLREEVFRGSVVTGTVERNGLPVRVVGGSPRIQEAFAAHGWPVVEELISLARYARAKDAVTALAYASVLVFEEGHKFSISIAECALTPELIDRETGNRLTDREVFISWIEDSVPTRSACRK